MSRNSESPWGNRKLRVAFAVLLLLGLIGYGYFHDSLKFKTLTNLRSDAPGLPKTTQPSGGDRPDILAQPVASKGDYAFSVRQDNVLGRVVDIDRSGGVTDNFSYRVRLTIKIGDIGDVDYYLNQSELTRLTVSKLVDGKEQPMTLNELRRGDRVLIEVKMDLYERPGSNLLEFKITKT